MQKNQDSLHDCELCKDTGFMLFEKKYSDHEYYYTTATYCTCKIGVKIADGHRVYFRKKRDEVEGKFKESEYHDNPT